MAPSFGFYLPALEVGAPVGPGVVWPPPPRQALPPPPSLMDAPPPDPQSQCWAKEPYDTAIRFTPPPPTPRFVRGNFTMLVPGFTGGHNDQDRSLLMTWDLPTHSPADQDYCLDYIATVLGHTHVLLSRPHGLNNGMTLDQLTATALKCKARGLFVIVIAISDGDSFDVAVPWLDHLVAQGALVAGQDAVCMCWQVERYYAPPHLCDELIAQSAYCQPRRLRRWVHWLHGACAWWTPADENDPNGSCERFGVCDRWSFQRWAVAYLDGHLGQLDHLTEIDQLQSNDAKVLASLPPGLVLCCAEQSAQGLYDRPSPEMARYGTQKGRYVMATQYGHAAEVQMRPVIDEHLAGGLTQTTRRRLLARLTQPLDDTRAARAVQALTSAERAVLPSATLTEYHVEDVLELDRRARLTAVEATAADPVAGTMAGGYLNDASFDDGRIL